MAYENLINTKDRSYEAHEIYKKCCETRLMDLLRIARQAYPGQTITKDFMMNNATLYNIGLTSKSTKKVFEQFKKIIKEDQLKKGASK